MIDKQFDWKRFHSYRVFDEFLETFLLKQRSYVSRDESKLDLRAAFEDIQQRFVADFDDSSSTFDKKVVRQFEGASENTKRVFSNVEYLWAMPVGNISPETKMSYAERWASGVDALVIGPQYFFVYPHAIANPGPWYLRNKYWELVAAFGLLSNLFLESQQHSIERIKNALAEKCRKVIEADSESRMGFKIQSNCGILPALLHLSNPDLYESIISSAHRERISGVFEHVVEKPSKDQWQLIRQIKKILYSKSETYHDPDFRYRWFFYCDDIFPLWIDKKSKRKQKISSAIFDVRNEEDAGELEGEREEIRGHRIRRSPRLVAAAKERDGHSCQACGFFFEYQIVHVHHLDPLSEYNRPKETTLDDLVTLCPNCHYLAHFWLREDCEKYKKLDPLLKKLK